MDDLAEIKAALHQCYRDSLAYGLPEHHASFAAKWIYYDLTGEVPASGLVETLCADIWTVHFHQKAPAYATRDGVTGLDRGAMFDNPELKVSSLLRQPPA